MILSQSVATSALDAVISQFNNGTYTLYSGTKPASPETALSGNTALATFTFSATAFGTPSYSSGKISAVASFVSSSISPIAGGTALWARAYTSSSVAIADFTVSSPWYPSTVVAVGQYVTNGGNTYVYTTAGTTASTGSGPTGTGTSITDGTAVAQYVGAGITTDGQLGNANIQQGVDVSITSMNVSIAAL